MQSSTPEEVDIELDFTWAGQQEVALVVKPIPKHLNVATVVTQVLSNIIMVKVSDQSSCAALPPGFMVQTLQCPTLPEREVNIAPKMVLAWSLWCTAQEQHLNAT